LGPEKALHTREASKPVRDPSQTDEEAGVELLLLLQDSVHHSIVYVHIQTLRTLKEILHFGTFLHFFKKNSESQNRHDDQTGF
jgi:hypothetical protein